MGWPLFQWKPSTNTRFALAAAFVFLFSILHKTLLTHRIITSVEPEQCIVVTGEFGKPAQYAESAEAGVIRSARSLLPSTDANVTVVRLESADFPGDPPFKQRFLSTIATRRVVAIVAADTSTTARRTISLGTTFRIPVLLVVATTDNLLSPQSASVFRLVSNDSRQARKIADWARTFPTVLIVSDASEYGHYLATSIGNQLRGQKIQYRHIDVPPSQDPYSITEGYGILKPAAAIFAGYAAHLPGFLDALARLPTPPKVLLSDGCYTPELSTLCSTYPSTVELSFPVDPFAMTRSIPIGFGSVASDAALAIRRALIDARIHNAPREELSETLRAVFSTDTTGWGALSGQYDFTNADGSYSSENMAGAFVIVPVPRSSNTTSAPAVQTGN